MDTKEKILINLEETFRLKGFAEPGVAELKKTAGVSLRTLYRYFPSKMDMVQGVLEYRHNKYKDFLINNIPGPGYDGVLHIFKRVEIWMNSNSSNGCLYMNALSSYPDNEKVKSAVELYKQDILNLFKFYSGRKDFEDKLYIIHEGLISAWSFKKEKATKATLKIISDLYNIK